MPRRIAESTLSLSVVLLMFGTSGIADDGLFFDLSSKMRVQQTAANAQSINVQPLAPQPINGQPMNGQPLPPQAIEAATPCPECSPVPEGTGEGGGLFGWRPSAPHFDLPSRSYSLFRSPASYGWAYNERCAPTPWTPRGDGIPRRTSCYRMDYRPYELKHDHSDHGPAFYTRYELYPCSECHEHAVHLNRYYGVGRRQRR